MSDDDKDSKTEDPTEKKVSDAFDRGNVPFSREVPAFASVLGALLFIVFYLPEGVGRVAEGLKGIFEKPEDWRIINAEDAMAIFTHLFWESSVIMVPIFTILVLFGIAASVFQNVPRPVLDRIQPKFNRLSIPGGFGRIFGKKGMVEFAKNIAKVMVISIIIVITMQSDYFEILGLMHADPTSIVEVMSEHAITIFGIVLISTAVLSVVDIFASRHFWYEDLRMSKQEIKDEMKQSDGDPAVKARQRSLARDRARKRMIAEVPRATLVIANPTHYAVALRYDADETGAPMVVAMGQDLIALKIREIAEAHDIPVFEDPPLARSMFAQVSLDTLIPPEFYKAVAELIHRIYDKSQR
jgi:flagellar biosynthetic protein FlhB